MNFDPDDNVVIIGASSSIGNIIVSRFHRSSANIIATFFNNEPSNKAIAQWARLNLESVDSIQKFVEFVGGKFKQLNKIICLAGMIPGKNLDEYEDDLIEKVMAVNFTGQVKVIKGLLPLLTSDSNIIMVSSISAQHGSYDPIYAAAKGAVLSFVKSFTNTMIQVNAVAPGLIEGSKMYNDMSEENQQLHRKNTASGRLLNIHDLAEVLHDISSNHWKHLNGACIDLNGGRYVR